MFHHRHKHAAGTGSVTTSIKLPKTMHVDGMPTEFYTVSVTPSQPVTASVSDQDKNGFIVTLTAPNGGAIAEGVLSILAIG
jgi:hypothetical protein